MDRNYVVEHVKTLIETAETERDKILADELAGRSDVIDINKVILEACDLLSGLVDVDFSVVNKLQSRINELSDEVRRLKAKNTESTEEASALRVRCEEQEVMLERANQEATDWARRHREISHKVEQHGEVSDYNLGYWKEKATKSREEVVELQARIGELEEKSTGHWGESKHYSLKAFNLQYDLRVRDAEIERLRLILTNAGIDPDKEGEDGESV